MKLWTYRHLITYVPNLLFMVIIAGIMRKFLLHRDEKIKLLPFRVLSLLLLGLEIIKQIVSIKNGYDLYHLPFHFCSMFIFFIPLAAFCRGKWRKHVLSFTTFISATLFLFMLIYPNAVYGEENITRMFGDFLSFHTVVFHNIVIFEFILIVALRLYKPSLKFDLKNALIFLSTYCLIGAVMAQIFKTNYNNFYSCTADLVDNVRLILIDALGYIPGQTVYVLGASAATLGFAFISYFVYIFICRLAKMICEDQKNNKA